MTVFIAIMLTLSTLMGGLPVLMAGDHEIDRVLRGVLFVVVTINAVCAALAWSSL